MTWLSEIFILYFGYDFKNLIYSFLFTVGALGIVAFAIFTWLIYLLMNNKMTSTIYTAAQLYGNNGEGTSSINLSASLQYIGGFPLSPSPYNSFTFTPATNVTSQLLN